MARITDIPSLVQYIKIELGEPVIKVNVAPEQFDQCVDNACERFIEYHRDGSRQAYITCVVTDEDVLNGYITTPENVPDVTEMVRSSSMVNGGFATDTWQYLSRMFKPGTSSLINLSQYVILNQRLDTIASVTGSDETVWDFEFSKYQRRLYPTFEIEKDQVMVFRCYESIDPRIEGNESAWNEPWLKEYVTQLVKRTWGGNLDKFGSMPLPGGVELVGSDIYAQAQEAIDKLEEDLRTEHQEMPLPMIG